MSHEDHLVVVQVGRRQGVVQAAGGTRPVAPPAVRSAADDVGAVDDQDAHRAQPSSSTTVSATQAGLDSSSISRV